MPFPIYDTQDAVPEDQRDVYEEREGKFHPKVGEDVTPLKTALEKERANVRAAEKAQKDAEARAAAAQREVDALKTQIGPSEERTKALLDKFDSDIKAAVAAAEKERDDARAELRTIRLDDKAKAAFIKAGGRPEKADAALELNRKRLDLAEDRIVVKDDGGEVSTTTIEDFWGKTYRSEMPEFYAGTKAAGGGASGVTTAPSGGGVGTLSFEQVLQNPGLAFEAANTQAA